MPNNEIVSGGLRALKPPFDRNKRMKIAAS
jgi:hypothetical protein